MLLSFAMSQTVINRICMRDMRNKIKWNRFVLNGELNRIMRFWEKFNLGRVFDFMEFCVVANSTFLPSICD